MIGQPRMCRQLVTGAYVPTRIASVRMCDRDAAIANIPAWSRARRRARDYARNHWIGLLTSVEKSLSVPLLLTALTAKYQVDGARSSIMTLVSAGLISARLCVY